MNPSTDERVCVPELEVDAVELSNVDGGETDRDGVGVPCMATAGSDLNISGFSGSK